jgi:hypothetical protein
MVVLRLSAADSVLCENGYENMGSLYVLAHTVMIEAKSVDAGQFSR